MTAQDKYRIIAARQLDRIEKTDAYVGLTRRGKQGDRTVERSVTETVSGVTRQRRYLDFLIDSFYRGKPQDLETGVRTVLRIGFYELLFTRTPDHAVINEAVETVKEYVHRRVTGLVNGILRSAARQIDDLPEPDTGNEVKNLAIRFSHPDWIVSRWVSRYGVHDTQRFLTWNNRRPRFGVYLRDRAEYVFDVLRDAGVDWEPSPWLDNFFRVDSVQPLIRSGLLSDGTVRIQDEAAALVVHALDPGKSSRMLDACAAPGSKSLYAADRHPDLMILATDINSNRLRLIERAVASTGLSNIETEVMDAAEPGESLFEVFDAVLVDAPCSGLGVLSKRADLRWLRSEEDLGQLTRLQDRILDGCSQCVKPGGLLLYATCTTEPEENEYRINAFLQRNEAFSMESMGSRLPGELIDRDGFYRSLPFRSSMDGAFAARLRRTA